MHLHFLPVNSSLFISFFHLWHQGEKKKEAEQNGSEKLEAQDNDARALKTQITYNVNIFLRRFVQICAKFKRFWN